MIRKASHQNNTPTTEEERETIHLRNGLKNIPLFQVRLPHRIMNRDEVQMYHFNSFTAVDDTLNPGGETLVYPKPALVLLRAFERVCQKNRSVLVTTCAPSSSFHYPVAVRLSTQ